MRTFDKVIVGLFVVFGVLAVIFGVGTIIHAYNTTKPSLDRLNEQIRTTLQFAERGASVLEDHPQEIERLIAPRTSLVDVVRTLPSVAGQAATVAAQTADSLESTAHTLREFPGVASMVVPEDAMTANAASLSSTADSLKHLVANLEATKKQTEHFAADVTEASQAAEQIQKELQKAHVTLARLIEVLEGMQQALDKANLPSEIAKRVSLQGGVYLLLAVVLFGMAGMWKRMSEHDAVDAHR